MITTISDLEKKSEQMRATVIEMAQRAGHGHVSSALSEIDILVALYHGGILTIDPEEPNWEYRDRFILSKGHGAIGLYSVLHDIGYISDHLMWSFGVDLCPHTELRTAGIDASTGSLGHGLPIAVGMAEAAKLQGRTNRVFCLLGDCELCEGSNWEAINYAAYKKLDNLICIVDNNNQGSMGFIEPEDRRLSTDDPEIGYLPTKFHAFGFSSFSVDGHNMRELIESFKCLPIMKRDSNPIAIICNTIKGKGCEQMENKRFWHGRVPK